VKVILWASLSANGNYSQATPENPPPLQVLQDVQARSQEAGCVIFGRSTYEEIMSRGQDPASLKVDIVVVSKTSINGVLSAPSPSAALGLLQKRGHKAVVVGGGEQLLNSFLMEGLADEFVFNFLPHLEGGVLNLHLESRSYRTLRTVGMKDLGGGVVQVRYLLEDKQAS
jgi:dihydrofolate reductase